MRRTFFHNGALRSLKEVLRFYAERDTNPDTWYPHNGEGAVRKFDDLPLQYQANINVDPPFDRHRGDPPALSEAEMDDIIAFLQTLNDGYQPASPASSPTSSPTWHRIWRRDNRSADGALPAKEIPRPIRRGEPLAPHAAQRFD